MEINAVITLLIILSAVVLFATELISIDLVALLIIVALVLTGVITPEQGVSGFSNPATVTVAFMFVISAALLKTGALQYVTYGLTKVFESNFMLGMALMIALIAVVSAFVNNTPVVAVFIPVMIQIAASSGISAKKMLIPLSFASIIGGSCTLIGSSTNILINGIVVGEGLPAISMFQMAPLGAILIAVGVIYMVFVGIRLLPKGENKTLGDKFGMGDYIAEIELTDSDPSVGKMIMNAALVRDLSMDVMEVRRNKSIFNQPAGDFILLSGDILKVRCDMDHIKQLKDRVKIFTQSSVKIDGDTLKGKKSTLVELAISASSAFEGKTLKEVDFRRRYRAVPLAIRHREEIVHNNLYETKLRSGDVLLADVKTHYLEELKKKDGRKDSPFIVLSEDIIMDFDKKKFFVTISLIAAMVVLASLNLVPIMIGALTVVAFLVLSRTIEMKDVYDAINWKVIFLLVGALSMGVAMKNTGLDITVANLLVSNLGPYGPIFVLSGIYLTTSLLTELMSNNATAAILAPIAIQTADVLEVSPVPFIMAVVFASSASFMTPVGYQTNTMVYGAGNYRFLDFFKVGSLLSLLFWILATFLIPIIFPF
ncbi:MAG: SLC13 family permease [Bacteroidota bacterium]